ncbi:MAG: SWIM zinc finger family protein [Acidobacteria bacterium]|nr:SWIM zinc finger family protein [Acidobacteriota bacterium]
MAWTTAQILALAPDAASAKAGQALAVPHKWSGCGAHAHAVWGLCQGSGKDPYHTQIELSEPAFRCSCPSRKFPCKHGLGLLLVYAAQPQAFTAAEPPAWVSEWLASRAQRAEQKAEKQAAQQAEEKAPDPHAQAKRVAARAQKVAAGLRELDLWLRDLVRNGLAAAQIQPISFWERAAARMVDAQAPGVARLIRELPGVIASGANADGSWQARLLERLAKLHLLREGYQRLDSLPSETQADIRATIGWTVNQEMLLQQDGMHDLWFIAGQRVEEEDRLRVQRTWLLGQQSGRAALVLQFAAPKQTFELALPVGALLSAELVFYPGAYPLRALLKDEHHPVPLPGAGFPLQAVASAVARAAYAVALARQPWLELFPLVLAGVTPFVRRERWFVLDDESRAWPLAPRYPAGWELLALSGGQPINLMAEWDGEFLWPLAVAGERFVRLSA